MRGKVRQYQRGRSVPRDGLAEDRFSLVKQSLALATRRRLQQQASEEKRDFYSAVDVEHYFNYMGMLAEEGTYDKLNRLQNTGLEPVDLLLVMAAGENDAPKVGELLRAGADIKVKGPEGKSPLELATSEEVLDLLQNPSKAEEMDFA
ncbi:hypothetical protein WJX74_004077 [Apatococcus lobatus]|uniref:Uncharacterized protein n=1 Tax=Apatococcus lobatus TaxID=904363 RepID=A0AAW1S4M2_9CHLO